MGCRICVPIGCLACPHAPLYLRSHGLVDLWRVCRLRHRYVGVPRNKLAADFHDATRCGPAKAACLGFANPPNRPPGRNLRAPPADSLGMLLVAAGELPDPFPPQIEELARAYLERFPPEVKA